MSKVNKVVFPIVLLSAFYLCFKETKHNTTGGSNQNGWRMVYKNNENGNQLAGNLDSLISGIRNGYDVRVGWGWEKKKGDSTLRIEHMAEPIFLTIIDESNVSVVIDAHLLLQSYVDLGAQRFNIEGHTWQCVLTTKGTFNAQVSNHPTGELVRNWPQKQRFTWFLDYPNSYPKRYEPLFD